MKWLRWLPAVAAAIVMVGLGAYAGRKYLEWRDSQSHQAHLEKLQRGELSALRPGTLFPMVKLVGPGGDSTSTAALVANGDALILFVSPECEGCQEALFLWNREAEARPGAVPLFGIAGARAQEVTLYARELGLGFPVYADEQDLFTTRYDLHAIPTLVGVKRGGRIAFIRHGIAEHFLPQNAESLLARVP